MSATFFVPGESFHYSYAHLRNPAIKDNWSDNFVVTTLNCDLAEDPICLAAAIQTNPQVSLSHVVVMQEFEVLACESNKAELIAKILGFDCMYFPARGETHKGQPGTHGLAIFSQLPLDEEVEIVELPYFKPKPFCATRRRIAVKTTLVWKERRIKIINTHLDTSISIEKRKQQALFAISTLLKGDAANSIFAGDINTTGYVFKAFQQSEHRKSFEDFMLTHGFNCPRFSETDYTNVWPKHFPLLRQLLDSVYSTMKIVGHSIDYSWPLGDHKPVTAHLR